MFFFLHSRCAALLISLLQVFKDAGAVALDRQDYQTYQTKMEDCSICVCVRVCVGCLMCMHSFWPLFGKSELEGCKFSYCLAAYSWS